VDECKPLVYGVELDEVLTHTVITLAGRAGDLVGWCRLTLSNPS